MADVPVSLVAKEILDNVSSMSPCIVVKDDGVRCQQVSALSPECSMKIFAKIKEPLRGSRYSRRGIIRAVGLSGAHQQKWTR
jgi:hypothetical protein